MGKLWAESIEAIDYGPVDAMRVGGASRTQVVSHAVVPAVTPQFVGLLLYRFDVNVRSSLVLGLVGAGGIGFLINESIKLFRFDEMLTHILVVLVLVVSSTTSARWCASGSSDQPPSAFDRGSRTTISSTSSGRSRAVQRPSLPG